MTTPPNLPLPGGDQSGDEGTWELPTTSPDPDASGGVLTLEARFLGVGSSRQAHHGDHLGATARPGERCGLCRWFETRIFKLGSNDYVLHHAGRSVVPGEDQLVRHERVYSAAEVVEAYTVRRVDEGRTFLTRPAARALAQAVAFDDDLREAYRDRSEELAASSVLRRLESRLDEPAEVADDPRFRRSS
jgi:hypothetical protein